MLRLLVLLTITLTAYADTVAMNNAAILYSPYNWVVTAGSAKTINSGAYFRVIVSGTAVALTTDTTNNAAPFSQLWARVDNTAWVKLTLTAGNPSLTVATGLQNRKHLLEVVVKSTSETLTRWAANSQTMVTLTGITVDTGATATAPIRRTKSILIFGDSITEGVRATNSTASLDTDRNDALGVYSYVLASAVDAEVGVVGFGASGILNTGSGGVPALTTAYALVYTGATRTFSLAPDLVIYNEGTNDSGSITAGFQTVMNGIIAAAPNSKHLLLIPFNNAHAAEITAAVAAMGSANVKAQSTVGWFNTADSSDALHPYDYAHVGAIAPKLFPVVQRLLYQGTVGVAW